MENGQGPTTKTKKRSAKKVAQILERGTQIFELRKNGASLRAISATLTKQAQERGEDARGLSYEQVRRVFLEMVEIKTEEQQDMVAEARTLTAERLEEVIMSFMPLARIPMINPKTRLPISDNELRAKMKAGDVIVKAAKEYAELYGAKGPQKLEVTGEDGKPLNLVTNVILEFSNDISSESSEA